MDEAVRALLELRELDEKMARLRRQLETKPAALKSQEHDVETTEKEIADLKEQLKKLQVIVDRRNVEVTGAEEAVKKLEGQLQSLKTNEDYQAMLRQIEAKKAGISDLEDKVLEGMEVLEATRADLPAKEAKLAERKVLLEQSRQKVRAEVSEAEVKLAELERTWKAKSEGLDAAVRDSYESQRVRYQDKAMVEVNPEGSCMGCHTRVTSQTLNLAMAGHLVSCNNCQRLLYMA